jgi:site-specific DNA-methyltransferase (adenine-specific)
MSRYPDRYFDLAVCDVPYGIGEDGGNNYTRGKLAKAKNYKPFLGNDMNAPNSDYFELINRKCKKYIIWGANHFIDNIPFNVSSPCWLVWNKMNGETDFADCELALTNFDTAVRMFTFRWQGMLQGNMKYKETRIHPTQKPIALYDWIFKNYLPEGGRVLDTHGGSMSSLISAIKAGNIEMTISELDADYYASAQKRVNDFMSQLNLFQERPDIIW